MMFRHMWARFRSLFTKLPISPKCEERAPRDQPNDVSLENPVFGSTVFEHCMKSEITRIIELIRQSITCTAGGERLQRKFPTPYIMLFERISLHEKVHTVRCAKAIDLILCTEYERGRRKLKFSALVFDRHEFAEFEKVIGHSLFVKSITQKQAPATIYTKTIVRLDGKHRKQQMHDAEMVARYVYELATITNGATKREIDYRREITGGSYCVSPAAAEASWSGLPSEIKYRHRPPRNKKTIPDEY